MKTILTLSLILVNSFMFAQFEVRHTSNTIRTIEDIYKIEITNRSGENKNLRIHVSLRMESVILYEATTNQFIALQSINQISATQLQPISVIKNYVNELQGAYQLEIQLLDNTNQVVYADRIRLTASGDRPSKNKEKREKNVQFSGRANIYGQVSDMQGVGSFVPRQYLRAEIHPDLLIQSIPIGLDVLLSTEQNAFKQSMNQVALRFDAQQFKQQMAKRLAQKVQQIEAIGDLSELSKLQSLKDESLQKKFPDLQKWQSQLKDPAIQSGLKQLKQLEAIEQILASKEVQEKLTQRAKLEAKKKLNKTESEELRKLQAFEQEIQKLQTKAKNVRAIALKYEQYKDLNKQISQAKRYAEKDILKDPSFIRNGLKSLDVMSRGQKLLNGFDAITVGTSYPYFSRLSLSSLSVDGVNIEWNPGKIYLATCYGRSARQTFNTNFAVPELTLPQTTLGVKIGYGSPYDSHFHLVFVEVKDQFVNEVFDNPSKAKRNRLLGTDVQFSLFKGNMDIGGEVMGSLLTRDHTINTEQVQEFDKSDIPFNMLWGNINNSSSFDIAWRAFTNINLFQNSTKLKGSIERVGANYYSLGAPVLLNDVLRWKAEARQSFFKNKLQLIAFARKDANNLDPLLVTSSSVTKSFGFSGALNIPKFPSLTVSYAPYSQDNQIIATNENLSTDATMFNALLGIPITIGNQFRSHTQFTYLSHDLKSNISGIDYNLKMYSISQSLNYKTSSINVAINYTPNQIINDLNQKVLTVNTSATVQLFSKWKNTLGFQSLNIKGLESRTGFYINSFFPIFPFADFEVRVQRNIYDTTLEATSNFQDIIGWGGLRVKW